jgi:DNA replication protein DnaC
MMSQVIGTLRRLRLLGMAEAIENNLANKSFLEMPFDEQLGIIVDHEAAVQDSDKRGRLLKKARLRHPSASIESLDYKPGRGLEKATMLALATGRFIQDKEAVVITGPTGTGKTYIACALAAQACKLGYSARYWRLTDLVTELNVARGDGSLPALKRQLVRTGVLIFDDFGHAQFDSSITLDLFDVIDERDSKEKGSIIFTSQLPTDKWRAVFSDPTVAEGALDRFVHSAHEIKIKGESMRKAKLKRSP